MRPWRIRSCVHGGSGLSDKPLFFKSTGIGSHLNCQSIYRAHEFKSEIELDFNLNWLQHKFCVSEIVWVPHSGWNPLTSPLSITVLQASYWESNFWSSSSNWRLDLKRLRAEPRTERDVCKHQKNFIYKSLYMHLSINALISHMWQPLCFAQSIYTDEIAIEGATSAADHSSSRNRWFPWLGIWSCLTSGS